MLLDFECRSSRSLANVQDVPHPMEIDKEEALAELGPDDVPRLYSSITVSIGVSCIC